MQLVPAITAHELHNCGCGFSSGCGFFTHTQPQMRANKRKSCENKDKEVHGQRQRRKWIFICLAIRRNMKQKPQPKSTKDKKRKIRNRKTRQPGLDLTSTDIVNVKLVKRRRIVNGIPLHSISNQINFFDSLHCASIRAFECQLLCPEM